MHSSELVVAKLVVAGNSFDSNIKYTPTIFKYLNKILNS